MKLSKDEIIQGLKDYKDEAIISSEDCDEIDRMINGLEEIQPERVVVKVKLTQKQKLDLIDYFHECYYNTDQDTGQFAVEFYYVVKHIVAEEVPTELSDLVDFMDGVIDIVPEIQEYI